MKKDSITKIKVLSFLLAFALLVGFLPMNLVQAADEMNYAKDEAMIKDYSDKERYRQTDLQPGDTNQNLVNTDEKVEKDGFKFQTSNPAADTPSKTQYGYQITIDKKTGQRTYTKITVTDSGLIPINTGNKPMMGQGDKLTAEYPAVSYKPQENTELTSSGRQRNLNYEASNETLEHINNKGNDFTSFGFKDNYTQNNPSNKFFGDNFGISYKVNPWPNENDTLQLIKLNGSHNKTEFVQGQTITTNISVENLDDNARERLVGQVYHPVTGEIVPGAKASINEMDKVVITMPEGVIDKNGNLNKDSIFYKDPNFKGIQSLEVKFFTRPRTADEFNAIAQAAEEEWDKGTYVGTGAGTTTINHKGQDVVIDKQGIDRYDHYNLIGSFKLNLDDTRYYDQGFIDGNKADTSKHTSSAVKPGEEFKVELYVPEDRNNKDLFPNQKTPEEMEAAKDANQAVGSIDRKFIDKINEGKAEEDKWILKYDEDTLPTTFTVTPPLSAKAGDFVAVPLVYTYTNGSTDTHWFHFVVQESSNNRPEYSAQVAFPSEEQVSPAKLVDDEKKLKPTGYYIPEGTEFKDDHGNEWNVSIDEKTGTVTAKPVDPSKFNGGEKLNVPVIAKYSDPNEPDKEIIEKTKAEFVIKERTNIDARYNAKAGKAGDELSSELIINQEDSYNRKPTKFTLASNTYTDDKGNTWNVSIDEKTGTVTATVPNAEDGKSINGALLNVPVTAHYFDGEDEVATKEVEVQFVSYGTNGTFETKETKAIEFETEYKVDNSLAPGTVEVEQEGSLGEEEVTVTHTIVDGEVTKSERSEPTRTKEPVTRKIRVGSKTDGQYKETETIPFEIEVRKDPTLKKGEWKYAEIDGVQQIGESGLKERTLTIVNSKVTEESEFKTTREPKNAIVLVGEDSSTGEVTHVEELPFEYKVEEVDDLKKGEYRIVKPGKVGTKTTTWTIKDSQIDGEPKEVIVPAEDALIQVGKGTNDGTHEIVEKKVLPFETIIEYDDSLEPGEEKVVQEGTPGEQERTNTLVIQDGKVVETKEGEFKTTKEPVNKIVKVGRKSSEGEVTKTIEREIPYETKVIYDENLEAGFQEIENEGKPGKEEVTITQKVKDSKPVGEATETVKTITEKEDRVVRVGVKPVVKEVELGHDTEYRHNPELKAGEEKVIEEGSKGYVKYTTTFNKETGKLEVTEERVEPKNKIVEYGTKTEGEFKYESEQAYDVIIRENPDLDAGTHKVVQEGIVGKTETTVKVVNSEEVSRETKTITEKQDMIIEIGTKNVCEIPPIDPENPEDPKDPETPGEEEPKDPETPGEETPREEEPKDPETPGEETPREEEPKDPETPGEETPREEEPKDPETPGEKTPETPREQEPGKPGKENPNKPGNKKPESNNASNPRTGDDGVMYIGAVALIAVVVLLYVSKKKNKNEQ